MDHVSISEFTDKYLSGTRRVYRSRSCFSLVFMGAGFIKTVSYFKEMLSVLIWWCIVSHPNLENFCGESDFGWVSCRKWVQIKFQSLYISAQFLLTIERPYKDLFNGSNRNPLFSWITLRFKCLNSQFPTSFSDGYL